MIRNEKEYQEAVRRLEQDNEVIEKQKNALLKTKLSAKEIENALEPVRSFHEQLVEEVEWYERVKRGDFGAISSLKQIGRILIALRIANSLSQKDLADKMGVEQTQISRDERNEYHGISVDRAQKILDLLNGHVDLKVLMDQQYRHGRLAKAS